MDVLSVISLMLLALLVTAISVREREDKPLTSILRSRLPQLLHKVKKVYHLIVYSSLFPVCIFYDTYPTDS